VSLSRRLASLNQYPAVDVLGSISRLMKDISPEEENDLAAETREILATYREAEDLINIGAYAAGTNPRIDRAIAKKQQLDELFRQGIFELAEHSESVSRLGSILSDVAATEAPA